MGVTMDYFGIAYWGIGLMAVLHFGAYAFAITQTYWSDWQFDHILTEWNFAKAVAKHKVHRYYTTKLWFKWSILLCFAWIFAWFICGCVYS
jgi:hypothetical protein